MTCLIDDSLDFYSYQLKDKGHIRWEKDHLLLAMQRAANQMQADRADLFGEDKRIKLSPGCYTLVCEQGCDSIRAPIYLEGYECDDVEIGDSESGWIDSYFPIVCTDDSDGEYHLDRVEINSEDQCKIKVEPEVPDDGIARYIIARCNADISEAIKEGGKFPNAICKHLVAFDNLVFFYAYGMDSMVNADQTQSFKYFENYLKLMELTYFNDLTLMEKKVVLGRVLGD